MPRARNLKPSFFTNDELAEIDPLGRLLFQGCWCLADRLGRLEDRPKKIKMQVLPYDNCDVDALLWDLHRHRFILRYEVGGQRYIQVLNFNKHQNPHSKEAESTIPAPDEHGASTVHEPKNPERAGLIPDSLNLIPDSGFPIPATPRVTGWRDRFNAFWQAYPKKKSKGDAERAWAKLKPSSELADAIIAAIAKAMTCEEWKRDAGQYIPHPASWLNAKGWEDEPTQTGPPRRTLQERKVATVDAVIAAGRINGRDITGVAERVDRPVIPTLPESLREQDGHDVGRG